ncbi:MAG: sigma 54-interacting transcriptional regulator [Myxococcales bacterium]|nr:sigma 54-interacting transcriptional regulator [Myxococcales bacterium]
MGPSPFREPPALVVLDDLDRAEPEVAEAVEAFRCRGARSPTLLVTGPVAPEGAPAWALGPLPEVDLAELCRQVEAGPDAARTSGGSPGWVLSAAGRGPLGREAILARVSTLSDAARGRLADVALRGGRAIDDGQALPELFAEGLLDRTVLEGARFVRLTSPRLWAEIARALATPAQVAATAEVARADVTVPPAALALLAELAPVADRPALLRDAATRARREEARGVELAALTTLATTGAAGPPELRRLERLARDLSRADLHAQTLGWLRDAGDLSLATLARVREAERLGRQGEFDAADARLAAARSEAEARRDAPAIAWCEATRGAVALYRADWETADRALGEARARLEALGDEREELARVDHNLGVVAIYQGKQAVAAEAFARALATKRALGDLPGVRASLLNLGLAETRLGRFDRARAALTEALALARSLGERTGRVWTSAALADLAVREGDPREAERHVAEAEAGGDAVPPAIAADLALLRAEIALLDGEASEARAALARIDPALRAEDAFVDGRALALTGRTHLAALPVDRRAAARAAIAALRRARAAGLPDVEAQARAVLADARAGSRHTAQVTSRDPDPELWRAVALLPGAPDEAARAAIVARCVVATSGAERAFVVVHGDGPLRVSGADADGFELPGAEERLPRAAVEAAIASEGPVSLREPHARVAIAASARGVRVAVIAEHRYLADAFADLAETTVRRWAALAAFVPGSAGAPRVPVPRPVVIQERAESTVVPALAPTRAFPTLVGQSPALLRALAKLEAALDVSAELPVLILGETGVGKELFARALHDEGPRASAPFVALNCAAVPDTLFEAELFGHVRGSFTGAERARGGLAARARGGTLFLDEIGELPLARQASLLRVLETRRYRPVGGDEELPLEARVVTATNRDLARAVDAGTFRRDLLYRLDVITLRVPALRERGDDVGRLALHFLRAAGSKSQLAPATLAALAAHPWPGNVRELAHLMQRLSTLGVKKIDPAHLPRAMREGGVPSASPPTERDELEAALAACDGNITRAAERLGVTRQGLKKRMVRLGVRAAKEEAS